jgi:hypothetical protein
MMNRLGFVSISAAVAASSCFALTGCGGSSDSTSTTLPTAPVFTLNIAQTTDVAGTFGSVGAYQQVTGTFTGEVDPTDVKNTIIQDLNPSTWHR